MFNGLLALEFPFAEALIYALVGFLVVFLGICILIFFVWVIGKIINAFTVNGEFVKSKKKAEPVKEEVEAPAPVDAVEEDVSVHTRLAIIAAVYACLQSESGSNCEFKIRKIKRI